MLVLYNIDFFCCLQYIFKTANFIKKEFYLLFWSCTKKKLGKFILMSILQICYLAKTIGSSHWKCWHKIFFVEHIQDPHFDFARPAIIQFRHWMPLLISICYSSIIHYDSSCTWGFLALLGDFGYSQNSGGTFSDFLIFFSPWLYLLIITSSSLKAAD